MGTEDELREEELTPFDSNSVFALLRELVENAGKYWIEDGAHVRRLDDVKLSKKTARRYVQRRLRQIED